MKKKTTSFCPVCKQVVPAVKYSKNTDVYLQKTCKEHGEFTSVVSKDAKRFFDTSFDIAGKEFTPSTKTLIGKCPDDCGWCERHEQHICTGLVEITSHCNMQCPVCYFGPKKQEHLSLQEIEERIDTLLKVERGKLDVLQISGGECLTHPQFSEVLDIAVNKPINRILINTNGHLLLKDEKIYEKIKENKDKVEIYLQFDGFDEGIYKVLRNAAKPLLDEKLQIIEKLNGDAIKIGLAVTVFEDNLKEIPKILKFACDVPHISGVTYQRLAKFGSAKSSELKTVLQEDILLAVSKTGFMRYKDIVPLPCSHPSCTSLAFLFVTKENVYNVGEYVDYTRCKDVISNRIAFDETVLKYLGDGVCDCFVTKMLGSKFNLEKLQDFIKNKASLYQDMKILRVCVKNFMDFETFDYERAKKCCVGVAVGDSKVVPFCVHNNLKG